MRLSVRELLGMTLVACRLRPLLKIGGACRCLLPRLDEQAADCTDDENRNRHHERRSHGVRVGLVKDGFEQRLEATGHGWWDAGGEPNPSPLADADLEAACRRVRKAVDELAAEGWRNLARVRDRLVVQLYRELVLQDGADDGAAARDRKS